MDGVDLLPEDCFLSALLGARLGLKYAPLDQIAEAIRRVRQVHEVTGFDLLPPEVRDRYRRLCFRASEPDQMKNYLEEVTQAILTHTPSVKAESTDGSNVHTKPSIDESNLERLTTDQLLDRLRVNLKHPGEVNTLRSNLGSVGLKKLQDGWTSKYDPDNRVWLPVDESRKLWAVQPDITKYALIAIETIAA